MAPGSQEEERGDAAEADPTGGQLGGRGQDWGDGPPGEPSITARDILRSRPLWWQLKMAVPTLKGRENFDSFSKQMKVYAKLHGFESVFDSDSYVEVGAEGSDRASLVAQGVTASMYEKRLMAWLFLSQALQTTVDQATFHQSKSPRECWESIEYWRDTKTNAQKGTCTRELYNFTIKKDDTPVEIFCTMEDLREKPNNAGISVDDNTLYTCFVSALPAAEYALEIRD